MDIKELLEKLKDAKFDLDVAKSRGTMVTARQEALKNILVNNFDRIIDALTYAADAEKKINVLEMEVTDADEELDEKDLEIRELKAQIEELQTSGKKKTKRPDTPDAGENGAGDDAVGK